MIVQLFKRMSYQSLSLSGSDLTILLETEFLAKLHSQTEFGNELVVLLPKHHKATQ